MVFVARVVVALSVFGFFAAPLYADVIPTRYGTDSGAAPKVEARLSELGVDAGKARVLANQLTENEASYFAWNPARLQLAGQENFGGQSDNFWWEWLFGAAALVGAGVAIYFLAFEE
jgi:hypothetical protein